MENKPRDPVDVILDAGLNSYAETEPLAGLEERILNRIGIARARVRSRRLPLLTVGSAALALFCLFVAKFEQKVVKTATVTRLASLTPSRPSLPRPRQAEVRRPCPMRQQLPKREQFPTPQPPTAEERALLRSIERDPNEAVQAIASLQREADKPLEIEPLEMKPLPTDVASN